MKAPNEWISVESSTKVPNNRVEGSSAGYLESDISVSEATDDDNVADDAGDSDIGEAMDLD